MSIERGDLTTTVWTEDRKTSFHKRRTTDADLAALGYVRVDVDVEALREAFKGREAFGGTAGVGEFVKVARQVLAALDGEEA